MAQSNCNRQTNNCPIGNSVVVDSIMVQSEYQTRGGIESAMPLRDRGGREIEWHRPERIHHHPRYHTNPIILFRDSVAHKAHPESTAISVNHPPADPHKIRRGANLRQISNQIYSLLPPISLSKRSCPTDIEFSHNKVKCN